jgi:Spy/CpxP family protein refolding chaperone
VRSKFILILAAVMLCAISMLGQPAAVAAKGAPVKQVRRSGDADVAKVLNLTKAQIAKLDRLKADTMKQVQAVNVDKRLSQDQKKTRSQGIIVSFQKKFMAVLTPAQVAKLKQIQSQENKAGHKKK